VKSKDIVINAET